MNAKIDNMQDTNTKITKKKALKEQDNIKRENKTCENLKD